MSDSRIETLLEALLNGTDPPHEPMSRVEAYLYALCKKGMNGSGGTEKTKLSQFENDLFYHKEEQFITLTASDFQPYYVIDDEGNPTDEISCLYYKAQPAKNCLFNLKNFGLTIAGSCNDQSYMAHHNISQPQNTSVNIAFYSTVAAPNVASIISKHIPISIHVGFDPFNISEPVMEDAYYIILEYYNEFWKDYIFSITLYEIDSKKIPIEYCDSSEIEEEIDLINGEVI